MGAACTPDDGGGRGAGGGPPGGNDGDDGSGDGSGGDGSGADDGSGGDGSGGDGSGGDGGDGGDDGGGGIPKFDIGVPDHPPEQEEEECTAVDMVFVVDNSGSMGDDQAAMAAAFPAFVDAMFTALPEGIDIHVGT